MAGEDAVGPGHKLPREMNRHSHHDLSAVLRTNTGKERTNSYKLPLAPHVFCVTDVPTLTNVIIIANSHSN